MRNPIAVLKSLSEKSQDKSYRFERLYRNLYNPEFYMLAYKNIYANDGSMTPGTNGITIDGMSRNRIEGIINSLKERSYQPQPARRTYIAKKNSTKKRPLGIASGDDKLLQEIVRLILESIYEPQFLNTSHGFRPKKSCHTALLKIQRTFTGAKWFIEGDIKACFDSFDHHVLINILRRQINDEAFIALMWKFLKAGYMEQWEYHATYSGTPQGSGVSPILANIYLHELDNYIEEYKASFDVGSYKDYKTNPEYERLHGKIQRCKRKNAIEWESLSSAERHERAKVLRDMKAAQRNISAAEPQNTKYKSIQYVRYADDFIISVIGSKADAERVKADIGKFISDKLCLTMSEEKTKITHTSEKARFLGYDIMVSKNQEIKRKSNGVRARVYSGVLRLYAPHEKWEAKLREYNAIKTVKDENGKDYWKVIHRGALINRTDIDILRKVNAEVRGLYNFYSLACNASVIGKFANIMKYSMLKTFAAKYRTKVSKIKAKYEVNGSFGVKYSTKGGMKQSTFVSTGFKKQTTPKFDQIDVIDTYKKYDRINSLASKIKTGLCELCGVKGVDVEIHQVKKLKNLTGVTMWEQIMLQRRRKTLAVCPECHASIHEKAISS